MTPEQFAYWLQGFVEIRGSVPSAGEWEVIKDHLATVFTKVTPDRITSPGPGITAPVYPPNWISPNTWPYTKPDLICSASVNVEGASSFSPIPQGDPKLLF